MPGKTDVRPCRAELGFHECRTRVPLKFGRETLAGVTTARVRLTVTRADGRRAEGWGETPLSVTWAWPSPALDCAARDGILRDLCRRLAGAWGDFDRAGHPLETGWLFQETVLPRVVAEANAARPGAEPIPRLAALVCCSPFDLALHDAYGTANRVPTWDTYRPPFLEPDLAAWLEPAPGSGVSFRGRWPEDYLVRPAAVRLPAWHLVGGRDPLDETELTGREPDDGYPVLLADWIRRDGLKCLKVKLSGDDPDRDYRRLVKVGRIAAGHGVDWLSADFNCTVSDPALVTAVLDRLLAEQPRLYGMLLYVEQPFPYDLAANRIDVRAVSARKPLFLDESAHDWRLVRLGRERGWTGVALKTCKTQTGAVLAACWARAHGMTLMVQDLTNPMLAQVPHCLLAAHVGTIMGVETNSMQFYPLASTAAARVHPGLYRRRGGCVDLSTLGGPGFGYRVAEIGAGL